MSRPSEQSRFHPDQVWLARTLVRRQLGIFPGFPLAVRDDRIQWVQVLPGHADPFPRSDVDQTHLAQAQHAVRRLQLIQSPEHSQAWLDRMEALIGTLSRLLRGKRIDKAIDELARQTVPRRILDRLRRIASAEPGLSQLCDCLKWLGLSHKSGLDSDMLSWIETHVNALSSIEFDAATTSQLAFCLLHRDVDPQWLKMLMHSQSSSWHTRVDPTETCNKTRHLAHQLVKQSKLRRLEPDTLPGPTGLNQALVDHVTWLLSQKPKRRRKVSRVLASLTDFRVFEELDTLECTQAATAERLRRELRKCRALGPIPYVIATGTDQIEDLFENATSHQPLLHQLSALRYCIEAATRLAHQDDWCNAIASSFAALTPFSWGDKVRLLEIWERFYESHPSNTPRSYAAALHRLAPVLKRQNVGDVLRDHWRQFLVRGSSRGCEVITEMRLWKPSKGEWADWISLVEATCFDSTNVPSDSLIASLFVILRRAPKLESAVTAVRESARLQLQDYIYSRDVTSVFQLTEDPILAARLLTHLTGHSVAGPTNQIACYLAHDPLLRSMLCHFVMEEKASELEQISRHTQILNSLHCAVPSLPDLPVDTAWMMHYPEIFRESLQELSRRSDSPASIAETVLSRNYPTPTRLRNEIEGVQRRLDALADDAPDEYRNNLLRRIDSLNCRLIDPQSVSQQRQANLQIKLRDRIFLETFHRFIASCRSEIIAAARDQIGKGVSQRLFEEPYNQLLPAIFDLSGKHRSIGIDLLGRSDSERKNAEPLEPENRRFLESLVARGVNVKPWLDASRPVRYTAKNGQQVELGFATDALETLLMGFHFDTCLSPDSFNFFAAVSNTIDINKQILYCRNDQRIVGRCLFAITSLGQIQTYHRYCHQSELVFGELVDQFATRLAAEMQTSLGSGGKIKSLVARRWYDDGEVRGGLTFVTATNDSDPLPSLLGKATPEDLLERLDQLFGCRNAVRSNLSHVLAGNEFKDREELIAPIFDAFGFDTATAPRDRMRIAVIANRHDRQHSAFQILGSLGPRRLPKRLKRWTCNECPHLHGIGTERELLNLLIPFNPSLARRYLVLTRDQGVERDEQESRPLRRKALARIHRHLGRQQLADRLECAR